MPSFVVVSTPCRVGKTVPALHYDRTAVGGIDKRSGTPIQVRLTSQENLLFVDDEPRSIIQTIGMDGKVTFLVTSNTAGLRNANCRRLARATALLDQVRDCLGSEVPKSVVANLASLSEWIDNEHAKLSAKPTP
jgi:hypothetical protein